MKRKVSLARSFAAFATGAVLAFGQVAPVTVSLADDAVEVDEQFDLATSGDCTKPGTEGSVSWRVEGTTLTISGNGYMAEYGEAVRAPFYEWGATVDTIVIEDGVKSIGNSAFYKFELVESVTIPKTIDAIRAAMKMQLTREEGTAKTNEYLKIGRFKKLQK